MTPHSRAAQRLADIRPPEDPSDPSWIVWLACTTAVAEAFFPNDGIQRNNFVTAARRITPRIP